MINKMFRKTPLAWRQLMKEKTRLLVAVAGIAFADMLIFIQRIKICKTIKNSLFFLFKKNHTAGSLILYLMYYIMSTYM